MTDRSTSREFNEVPEADLVEQSVPADPNNPDEVNHERDLATEVDRDHWSADPADVAEQSIPVPLDDEDRDAVE